MRKVKRIAYEAVVIAWDIYIGLAPFSLAITAILYPGVAWKLLGW